MSKIQNGNLIILCLAEILLGILLLINPVGFSSGIIIFLGIILAVMGIISVIAYFRADPYIAAQQNSLAKGLLLIGAGCICIFQTKWFLAAFPLITVFYGILIFISGISKVQWAVDMLRQKQKYWFITLFSAVLSVVFATLILANPFSSTTLLWRFIAICLIVEAVMDIIALVFGRK